MVDELLAKLEVGTVSIEPRGGGGIPQLTAQDVAAALAICEDKFAATMYQVAAGGTIADWKGVDHMLAQAQFGEWRNRADRMISAQLAKAAVAVAPKSEQCDLDNRAGMMLSGAKAAMWPALVEETYTNMRQALIAELRASRVCQACEGHGQVLVETKMEECTHCLSTGLTFISDRQRAHMLGIAPSSYRQAWKPVYEWMYRMLIDAVARGRAQFSQAMERLA